MRCSASLQRSLRTLVPEAHRQVPVGMFGHSLGGAAAAEALLLHPRLQAGVDLDGTPFGRVVHEGLDEPFGIMLSITRDQPGHDDPNLELFIANLRGPRPVRQLDVGHNGSRTSWSSFPRPCSWIRRSPPSSRRASRSASTASPPEPRRSPRSAGSWPGS